jgi:hypothetical protein
MDWNLKTAALKFEFELLHALMPTTPGQGVAAQNQNGLVTVQPSTSHQGFTVNSGPAITFDPLWNLGFIVQLKGDVPSAKGKGECTYQLYERRTALLWRHAPLQRGE